MYSKVFLVCRRCQQSNHMVYAHNFVCCKKTNRIEYILVFLNLFGIFYAIFQMILLILQYSIESHKQRHTVCCYNVALSSILWMLNVEHHQRFMTCASCDCSDSIYNL